MLPRAAECIFCYALRSADDRTVLVVYRGHRSFVMLNRYPYTNGHVMIAPNEHRGQMAGTDDETLLEVIKLTALSEKVLEAAYHPGGLNIGMNLGVAAGAGVAEHFHIHIVPRWVGDTNYMTVVADTRVVPEDLLSTYDRLKPLYSAEGPS